MGLKTEDAGPSIESVRAASELLKNLANPHRLLIVCTLVYGERSVGQMEQMLGIRQPTLSQQLGELREAGLVKTRRAAKQVFYRLADTRAIKIITALEQIFCDDASREILRTAASTQPTADRFGLSAAWFAEVVPPRPRRSS